MRAVFAPHNTGGRKGSGRAEETRGGRSKEEIVRLELRGGEEPSARGDHTTQHRQEKRKRESSRSKREREQ